MTSLLNQRLASLVWSIVPHHLLSAADLRPLRQMLNSDVWLLAPVYLELFDLASDLESGVRKLGRRLS